jgi:hypothetical protein
MTMGWLLRLGALACVALAACSLDPTGQKNMVALKLAGGVYKGEWKPGYLYQVSFNGSGGTMRAEVRMADDDNARTVENFPARAVVFGNTVELRYLQDGRIDKLVYIPEDDELQGQPGFQGAGQDRVWAKRVSAGSAAAGPDGAQLTALFPEFTWAPASGTIFTGRDASGMFSAICLNDGVGSQESLVAECGVALGRQIGLTPTSPGSLSWTGYSTFKSVGPNSGDVIVVVGKDNGATMDESVKVYKALAGQQGW